MNRTQRRPSNAGQRKTGRVQDYRVPPGKVALTFDFAGFDPSTFETPVIELSDAVAALGRVVAEKPYPEVLRLIGTAFRELKAGNDRVINVCLLAWWAAFNHPTGGAEMREAVTVRMVRHEAVHISFHSGATGGVAYALSDRFVDLKDMIAKAKAAASGVVVVWTHNGPLRETVQ